MVTTNLKIPQVISMMKVPTSTDHKMAPGIECYNTTKYGNRTARRNHIISNVFPVTVTGNATRVHHNIRIHSQYHGT